MDSKSLVAAFVALVVGVCIGYFMGSGDPEPPPPASTRGEWPMVPCPPDETGEGQMAWEVCDQITNLAMAVQPPTLQSMNCAVKAQRKKSGNPPDPMAASATLFSAFQAAQQGNWVMCEQGLDTLPD